MGWTNRQAKVDYRGVNYIHPLKQRQVELFLEEARKISTLRYLIVFGSATEERCTPSSDVDIVSKGLYNTKFVPPECDDFDIIYAETSTQNYSLWKEVLKNGVLIYDSRFDE